MSNTNNNTVSPELLKAVVAAFEKGLAEQTVEIDIPDKAVNCALAAKLAALESRVSFLQAEVAALKAAAPAAAAPAAKGKTDAEKTADVERVNAIVAATAHAQSLQKSQKPVKK